MSYITFELSIHKFKNGNWNDMMTHLNFESDMLQSFHRITKLVTSFTFHLCHILSCFCFSVLCEILFQFCYYSVGNILCWFIWYLQYNYVFQKCANQSLDVLGVSFRVIVLWMLLLTSCSMFLQEKLVRKKDHAILFPFLESNMYTHGRSFFSAAWLCVLLSLHWLEWIYQLYNNQIMDMIDTLQFHGFLNQASSIVHEKKKHICTLNSTVVVSMEPLGHAMILLLVDLFSQFCISCNNFWPYMKQRGDF